MDPLVWLVLSGAVLIAILYGLVRSVSHGSSRPVLPSHYDPQNYLIDRSKIPGWCETCEVMNDPGYRFCENCGGKLRVVEVSRPVRDRHPFSR